MRRKVIYLVASLGATAAVVGWLTSEWAKDEMYDIDRPRPLSVFDANPEDYDPEFYDNPYI